MPVLTDIASLVATYSTQINQIRRSVTAYARRYWLGMDSWRSADIDKMVTAIAPAVQAGQINVAALTDAYLARYEAAVLGTVATPVGVSAGLVSDLAMRGVATAEVYGRAGPTIWTALAEGVALTDATHQALVRMLTTIETDLQLARTHSAREVLSKKQQVVGYRRVISGVKTCRLCVTASTQRYRRSELMALHHNCHCGVAPIYGTEDPGRVINLALLQSLKDSGISGELALEQSATRASKKSRSLRDQKQALRDQLDATTDPTQRSRIGRQISLINDRIDQANADVARRREQLAEYRGDYPTPEPSTIAVQHHSELGPYLTDAAHSFKSIADLNLN